jgi:ribosomal protein L31E
MTRTQKIREAVRKHNQTEVVEVDPVVWVRRQWNDWRHAQYRLSDISGLHWDDMSGGVQARAPRMFLHGYVLCDGMVSGELAHSCRHGPPPHKVKVCIVKKGNEDAWALILKTAPPK